MRDLRQEEVAEPTVDPGGHAQLERADRALRGPDPVDRVLHVRRCTARPRGMAITGEEQEKRVAAELEHVATVALGGRDQLREDPRDRADELLGTFTPSCRELLR